ncbi:nucleoside phosphorylase [Kitasatospora sp. NPDC058046]|uniref:nucleoside phosphorylase n=1 Tax=Kitasatospora sp. NPDC058046 TaxID=3346312 RepID=UPI0036DFA467
MTEPAVLPFPGHPGKFAWPSITDPADHVAYVRTRYPGADLSTAAGAVLVYPHSLLEHARTVHRLHDLGRWTSGTLHLTDDQVVLCSGFGRGAPAAALLLEQLVALGVRRIITVGTAATLQPDLPPGTVVVVRQAYRDEGTSHHYLPPGRTVEASAQLSDSFWSNLDAAGCPVQCGAAWTSDALYHETAEEVRAYAAQGVLAADMEAAGMLAVAQYRNVAVSVGLVIADSLAHRTPRADHPDTTSGLRSALGAAMATLTD